jgi:hypothetical protein
MTIELLVLVAWKTYNKREEEGMNCYKHPHVTAVATCSQGCGRSLCSECSEAYHLPTCDNCAAAIESSIKAEITESRNSILKKIVINVLFLIPYIIILASQQPSDATMWLLLVVLAWGFIGFRWLLNTFLAVTGLAIFTTLGNWGFTYCLGSVFVGICGFLVIPVLVIMQLIQLYRLPKEDMVDVRLPDQTAPESLPINRHVEQKPSKPIQTSQESEPSYEPASISNRAEDGSGLKAVKSAWESHKTVYVTALAVLSLVGIVAAVVANGRQPCCPATKTAGG